MIKMGIIGCGNMGGAMLRRMLGEGIFSPEEIIVSDKNEELLNKLYQELGVQITTDNRRPAQAPCLLLAVKPQFLQEVADDIRTSLKPDALILSIVMGYDLSMLAACLGREAGPIVRVMPNTPAMVAEGVLAACRNSFVKEEQWAFAMRLLSCMGMAEEVKEAWMDAVTGLSGSSPAFVFLFLEALSDAGVRGGLPRPLAQRFAAQTVLGSAKLALETGMHPGQLKDMVTSPAGTTIEGVAALEKDGFRYAVMDAVNAAVQKSISVRNRKS